MKKRLYLCAINVFIGSVFAVNDNSMVRINQSNKTNSLTHSSVGQFYVINMCRNTTNSASLLNNRDKLKSIYDLPSARKHKPWEGSGNLLVG